MMFYICPLLALLPQVLAIWPAPVSLSTGGSVLWISSDVEITYNGASCSNVTASQKDLSSQALVQGAIYRAKQALFKQSLVPWKLVPRNKLSTIEPNNQDRKTKIKALAITQTGKDNSTSYKPLDGELDESYNLTITADGAASINAVSAVGVLHALETFTQLFYQHSTSKGIYTNLAPVAITDAPKFPHRGLNMDVARNWYPVEHITRMIDALAMNKFNRLHIHMTDAQSWPMDIPALPELSAKGAYQTGLSYTPKDITDIYTYGIQRGIEVYIEIDMPGHTTSIGVAYPELITAFEAQPWDKYCAEPPCGSLKLNEPKVGEFLDKLFGDVLPRIAPYTSYFHTGGDEVNKNTYLLDPTVKSNDPAVIGPLIQKLVDQNHALIRKAGLTPIVWEEMLLDWNLTLGSDVIVQTWQSDANVAAVTAKGHKALAGNYNYWYLDCGKGQWLNFDNGASFKNFYPFADYCSPSKNWRLVYSYDPLAGVPADQAHLVLGGEVHIWSEQTDPVNVDDVVWPRAAAAGEVLWSGRQDATGQNRSQITAAPRLAELRERMVLRGIQSGPVQMVFCTQNNGTVCSL